MIRNVTEIGKSIQTGITDWKYNNKRNITPFMLK
jgi:hypothetical protein